MLDEQFDDVDTGMDVFEDGSATLFEGASNTGMDVLVGVPSELSDVVEVAEVKEEDVVVDAAEVNELVDDRDADSEPGYKASDDSGDLSSDLQQQRIWPIMSASIYQYLCQEGG